MLNLPIILPEITLFCGALIILMIDVFCGKKFKNICFFSHLASLIFTCLAIYALVKNFTPAGVGFNNMFESNSFTSLMKAVALGLLAIVILFSLNFVLDNKKISAEFLALLMIATTGGMVLISANDFLVFYLGLELQALSLYLLAAINKSSAKSAEAGMKYFILGSLASGILLFGISLIYGFSGTTNFSAIMDLRDSADKFLTTKLAIGTLFGFILVISAMFFKIAAAPFHSWSPDVYEGSPTIVTSFFATIAKLTVTAALIHLLANINIKMPGIDKIFIFVAILSLALGSLGAIFQKNIKRLLAYSSIGHIGFILLGLASLTRDGFSVASLYLIIYALISIGSFGFLLLLGSNNKNSDEEDEKIFNITALSGLSKTNPVMALCLAILMFSSAGIPPLAGFFSKFYILNSAIAHGFLISAIIAVLFSVISAYYYLRIVKIMYFDEPQKNVIIKNIANIKFIIFASAAFNIILIFLLDPILNSSF